MPGFSGIFYAYVLLNVTLYRKLKRKGERMPEFIWLIIGAVVGIALGFVVTRYLVNASTKRAAQEAESVVSDAKRQAETLRREAIIEAKDEALKLKQDAQAESKERLREVRSAENRISQREESLDRRVESLDAREHQISSMQGQLERRERDLEEATREVNYRLERVAGMTPDEAKAELLDTLKDEVTHESAAIIRDAEARAKAEADTKRHARSSASPSSACAADHVAEATVSVVPLPNDEMKGRIIGREGRNIRTLETSDRRGSDHRRHAGGHHRLLLRPGAPRDRPHRPGEAHPGRPHPSHPHRGDGRRRPSGRWTPRIKAEGEQRRVRDRRPRPAPRARQACWAACATAPATARTCSTTRIEVSHLAGLMAAELGARSSSQAKRAGLLHDLGKARRPRGGGQPRASLAPTWPASSGERPGDRACHRGAPQRRGAVAACWPCSFRRPTPCPPARPGARTETLDDLRQAPREAGGDRQLVQGRGAHATPFRRVARCA